jgi:hypothetical protein
MKIINEGYCDPCGDLVTEPLMELVSELRFYHGHDGRDQVLICEECADDIANTLRAERKKQ